MQAHSRAFLKAVRGLIGKGVDKTWNSTHTKAGVIAMAKESACFTVGGISGKHDVKEIKRGLDTLPGVLSVSVSGDGRVAVDFDTTGVQSSRIERQLAEMGYQVLHSGNDG